MKFKKEWLVRDLAELQERKDDDRYELAAFCCNMLIGLATYVLENVEPKE
jgi:hypothetical protein